jgi:hypothetical protein
MLLVAGKQDGHFLFKNCRDFPFFRLEIRQLFSQPGENYCRDLEIQKMIALTYFRLLLLAKFAPVLANMGSSKLESLGSGYQ